MNIIKENLIWLVAVIAIIVLCVSKVSPPIKAFLDNSLVKKEKTLQVSNLKKEAEMLEKLHADNSARLGVKEIYKSDYEAADVMSSFGPMFQDIIDFVKSNDLRLKSVAYRENPPEDIIVKNTGEGYNVCVINMVLIGSYSQIQQFFSDLNNYPFMINVDKVLITAYENDKRLLIVRVDVVLYSKKAGVEDGDTGAKGKGAKALQN